ncbi:MAG TPA: methylmalonyl Co-A mutase-associated GTPase MeaB, partial [Chitinophagaceae bacterium]|nr:methylmalonyl Co-A mutase-associated GTPase MeaB [Chitinophagaceae bacterium]
IEVLVARNLRVAVLCVDPSSAFNRGALLGDRIRMSSWYTHPNVFIRSLATRGSLGGLNPKIIEITDVLKAAPFDHIIIETVGVGQTEVEIAGLADTTVVVLVPEGGDEVQTMKAGLMEIADVFVVNKSDRPGADLFVKHLRQMMAPAFLRSAWPIEILKTAAAQKEGIEELLSAIERHHAAAEGTGRRSWLLAEKAWQLIQNGKMKGLRKEELREKIQAGLNGSFNLYRFVQQYL